MFLGLLLTILMLNGHTFINPLGFGFMFLIFIELIATGITITECMPYIKKIQTDRQAHKLEMLTTKQAHELKVREIDVRLAKEVNKY